MYWCVNIVAILLMIAVLEINPDIIHALSKQAGHDEWQLVSHIAIAITLVVLALRYFIRLKPSSNFKPIPSHPTTLSTLSIQSILITGVLSALWIIPLLLAILSSALAQRLLFEQHSIKHPVYVEAWVTPVGISDRQLQFTTSAEGTSKVSQGYRLLAELSQISPYYQTDTNVSGNPQDSDKPRSNNANNPFTSVKTLGEPTNSAQLPENMRVLITSFNRQHAWLNELKPNESVYLKLALHPLKIPDPNSKKEFNEYRWLSTRHATATATVLKTNSNSNVNTLDTRQDLSGFNLQRSLNLHRYALHNHLQQLHQSQSQNVSAQSLQNLEHSSATQQQAMAVTLSLLTGDRSLITSDTTALYRFAGISHLLAISGAHVLFLAILAAWLATRFINRCYPKLYRHISRWQVHLIIAVVVAFVYALYSGFDVPALRTACMLLMVGAARYLLLSRATFKLLMALATLMAWYDIFVLWQAGFWLSFVAVGLLVAYSYRIRHSADVDKLTHSYNAFMAVYSKNRSQISATPTPWYRLLISKKAVSSDYPQAIRYVNWIYRNLRQFILLQLWMTITLLPISLWLFGEVSLWGILVNMFAIAFFGWIIVPLNLLAGLIYSISTPLPILSGLGTTLANSIWQLVFSLMQSFHIKLIQLQVASAHTGWLYTPISLPIVLVSLLVLLPWLLPKGVLSRLLSIPTIILLSGMLINQSNSQDTLGIAKESQALVITPLSPDIPPNIQASVPELSATLLTTFDSSWLLLADYPSNKNQPNNASFASSSTTQAGIISNALYKSLAKHRIHQLTGVIVQTPSLGLSDSVQHLKDRLPIQYYWQAGSQHLLSTSINPSTTSPLNNKLVMQSCDVGRTWQTPVANETTDSIKADSIRTNSISKHNHTAQAKRHEPYDLQISAVTGWQDIEDSAVWGCALQLQTRYPVYITDDNKDTITHTRLEMTNHFNQTELIVNSAQHTRLWQLWALMCPMTDASTLLSQSVTQPPSQYSQSATIQRLSNNHWLSSKPAVLNQELIDMTSPLSLTILSDSETHINDALMDNGALYWQQQLDRYINEDDSVN